VKLKEGNIPGKKKEKAFSVNHREKLDSMELRNKRFYLTVPVLTLVFAYAFFAPGCGRKFEPKKVVSSPGAISTPSPSPSPTPSEDGENIGPIQFKGTTIQSLDGKRKHWSLTAREVKYDDKSKITTARVVECVFFGADNEEILKLEARGAQVDMETNSLKFKGAVKAESFSGESLEVKELRWDGKKKKLIGDKFIKLTRKDAVMTARKMSADPGLKEITLSGGVKVVYPNAEKFLKI
jgi:LPS export ABC transporter protein LptC